MAQNLQLSPFSYEERIQQTAEKIPNVKVDVFVKSPPGRHSREGGSPEDVKKTGFPPPRE